MSSPWTGAVCGIDRRRWTSRLDAFAVAVAASPALKNFIRFYKIDLKRIFSLDFYKSSPKLKIRANFRRFLVKKRCRFYVKLNSTNFPYRTIYGRTRKFFTVR